MQAPKLSPREKSIYDYVKRFVKLNGYPPAIRQIQEDLNISSTSVVAYNLRNLEAMGLISRTPGLSRGLVVIDDEPDVITESGHELYLKQPGELSEAQRSLLGTLLEQAYQLVKRAPWEEPPAWLVEGNDIIPLAPGFTLPVEEVPLG